MCDRALTYASRNPFVRRYFRSRLAHMVQVTNSSNAKVILDIGCGKGELLKVLAGNFAGSEYVGIDVGKEIYAMKKEAEVDSLQETHFVRADCMHLPLKSACSQLVFCASVLEHLPDVMSAASEITRTLDFGGRLVIGMPTENFLYRIARGFVGLRKPVDHFHRAFYLEAALEAMLDHEFVRSRVLKLPLSFLPTYMSLYLVLVYDRRAYEPQKFRSGSAGKSRSMRIGSAD